MAPRTNLAVNNHEWPYDILSVASYYVGNKRDSLSYGIKALSLNGSEQRLKDNLELILNNTTDKDLIF